MVDTFIAAFATLAAVALGYYFSRLQHNTEVRVDRLRRKIDALERVWSLLAYMSQQRSESSIIYWREDKRSSEGKRYMVHFGNLQRFYLREVSDVFYRQYVGLYMPASIRDMVYDYLHDVAYFYYRYKDDDNINEDSLIEIEKPQKAISLREQYAGLNAALKKELDKAYKELYSKL